MTDEGRDRAEGPSGGWADLESILEAFEQRRAGDLEARRESEAAEEAFRSRFVGLLTEVVIPILESTARSLSRRAHECSVTRRLADHEVPSVDLTIRPYAPDERWSRRSRLSMRGLSAEGFVTLAEVQPPRKDPIETTTTRALDEVTEDVVRDEVLRFVRAVLDEY